MRKLALALGTVLFAVGAAAQTPAPGFSRAPACLTSAEARGLVQFVMPALVEGLARKCRGRLTEDAFLRTGGASALAQRLRRDGEASWPVAKRAIEKITGDPVPTPFGERFSMRVAEGTAASRVLEQFDAEDCRETSTLVGALSPLPAANVADAMSAILALGARKDPDAPLRICAAPASASVGQR